MRSARLKAQTPGRTARPGCKPCGDGFLENPDFGGIAGGYMGVVDAEAVSETDVTEEKQGLRYIS